MKNETNEMIHFESTILKRTVDGHERASSYLDPGEETIEQFSFGGTDNTPPPPAQP